MRRPRFQFRLSTLLIAVAVSGVSVGMLRAFFGPEALIFRIAISICAGFAFMAIGTKMANVATDAIWPPLLSLVGLIVASAGLCVGTFYCLEWLGSD
jgi:hypothetical protein